MDKRPARIAEEAAEYFAREVHGSTPLQRQRREAWRTSDPRHAAAYDHARHVWEQLGALDQDAELEALLVRDLATLRRRERWIGRLPMLATAALLMVALGSYLLYSTPSPPVIYATALGERHVETLPDGSRIVLNTQTEVQVRFARNRRQVELLQGEAQFEVAHDAARPFVVVAGEGTVTALGTRFQVRRAADATIVTLLQGSVEVVHGPEHRKLQPNEQARLSPGHGTTVQPVDPELASGWLDGRLRFRGTALRDVIAEANRYSERKLRLGDPALGDIQFNGSFQTGDSASIAAAAALILPVRVENKGAEIVLQPQ